MRRSWLVLLLLAAGTARAEDSDDDVVADPGPVPRDVQGRLVGASAHLTAHIGFEIPQVRVSSFSIGLPEHAVVTAASATVEGIAHRLALTPADDAGAAFAAVLTRPVGADPGWAVNLHGEPQTGSVTVDVIAPRTTRMELDLQLEAPTCYYRDARYLAIPTDWTGALDRTLARQEPSEELEAACHAGSGMAWIAFPSRALSSKPAGEQRIAAFGERLAVPSANLAHVEIDISRELGEVPADLYTAIVIDSSRSMTDKQVDSQRAIVEAYMHAAPHGLVQIIAYSRDAHALLPAWSVAVYSRARIDRAIRALSPRNGSNLDAGLAEAAAWLAKVHGTRRVIVFSDELVASRLSGGDIGALATLLPADTLVHVVALDNFDSTLARDDNALFAALAAVTSGLSARGATDEHGDVDATMLARPVSLDKLELAYAGWEDLNVGDDGCATLGELHEGATCAWWGQGKASSGPVTLTGMIWGRKVARTIVPDPARGVALARMLSAMSPLDSKLMSEIERAALAANTVWSLFARWGGQNGYEPEGECGCGMGTSGFGSHSGGITDSFGTAKHVHLDLSAQFQPGIARCRPGKAHIELEVETTKEEIVDVAASVRDAPPGQEHALQDCVVEAAWKTMLAIPDPPSFYRARMVF